MDGSRPPFVPAADSTSASAAEGSEDSRINAASDEFTPLAPAFQRHTPNELINMLGPQEPRPGDTAPMSFGFDDMMRGMYISRPEMAFEPDTESIQSNYSYVDNNNNRAESVASSRMWSDVPPPSSSSSSRPNENMTTFDFLVKSVSAANNYVSMLSREQMSVLQALRPSLLYEFLLEIAKVRSEKRTRRALPHECAFCKNNGENEEHYTSHSLKDWRGRVLCPVLRAFRCPRCGSTGDRAHTIKYCPENDADRHGLSSRRRMTPSASLFSNGYQGPNDGSQTTSNAGSAPPPSPSQNDRQSDANSWTPFGYQGPNGGLQSTSNVGSAPPPSPSQNDRKSDDGPWTPFG